MQIGIAPSDLDSGGQGSKHGLLDLSYYISNLLHIQVWQLTIN